jgi:hypothetical protein
MRGRTGSMRDAGPAGPLDFKGAPGGREQRQPPRRRPSRPLDAGRPGHQRSEEDHRPSRTPRSDEDHRPSASRLVHIVPAVQNANVQKKITNHLHLAQFTSSGHNKTAQTPFSNQPIAPRETTASIAANHWQDLLAMDRRDPSAWQRSTTVPTAKQARANAARQRPGTKRPQSGTRR